MKTLFRNFLGLVFFLFGFSTSYAAVSVTGPQYTCADSELIYYYQDDWPAVWVTFDITNGEIYNEIVGIWQTSWQFNRSSHTHLNNTFPFKIRWNASGTGGNVKVRICNSSSYDNCQQGDLDVTFGAEPGTPTITGASYLLNCLSETKNYTATNIPLNWYLVDWTFSSQIQQAGGVVNSNPVGVQGTNTTYTGNQTVTGVFHFITDGNHCATQYVNKNIWIGRPDPTTLTLNGGTYSGGGGSYLCGDNWVGIEYSTPVSSTSWTFDPSMYYYYSDEDQCNFNVDFSSPTSWRITAVGTNACGAGYAAFYYLDNGCWSFMVSTYPNPAGDELTIETSSLKQDGSELPVIASEVLLFDKSGSKIARQSPVKSVVTIDTKDIRAGQYFLQIKIGEKTIKKHILIEK